MDVNNDGRISRTEFLWAMTGIDMSSVLSQDEKTKNMQLYGNPEGISTKSSASTGNSPLKASKSSRLSSKAPALAPTPEMNEPNSNVVAPTTTTKSRKASQKAISQTNMTTDTMSVVSATPAASMKVIAQGDDFNQNNALNPPQYRGVLARNQPQTYDNADTGVSHQ